MFVRANGIQMNHEISGMASDEVVMLSHSLGSNLEMWNPQITSLGAHFRVLRYDIRGHGGSDAPPGSYTLEMLGDDAVALLDALALDKVHFVGLSLGGMIGQRVALDHPGRIRTLALCDTSARMPAESQPALQERIDTARRRGMAVLVDSTLERWFTPAFLSGHSEMLDIIKRQLLSTPVEGYVGCSEAIRTLDLVGRLNEIHVPTLILVGEEDPGSPVSTARSMHERIGGSKLVIIPSARHLSNVEQSEIFNSALLEFLRTAPGR